MSESHVTIQRVADQGPHEDQLDLLSPGDSVQISVTHEVTVDGEKSWIKHGAITQVRDGETSEQTQARLSRFVALGALKEVEYNVQQIRAFIARYQ